MIMEEDGVRHS